MAPKLIPHAWIVRSSMYRKHACLRYTFVFVHLDPSLSTFNDDKCVTYTVAVCICLIPCSVFAPDINNASECFRLQIRALYHH